MSSSKLEFLPISSSIDPSFWNKLYEIKLNVDKLNETHHSIWGYFSNINNKSNVPLLEVNSTSFNKDFESQKIYIPFHGKVLNVNTIEQFKDCDKTKIINDIGREVFENIESGEALEKPSLLNSFFILSFADLKKFNFYYWFAFPVPYNLSITCNSVKNISDDFNINQLEEFWDKYCELDKFQKPYFLLQIKDELVNIFPLKSQVANLDENNHVDYYFGFYDLSLLENCPGSLLRNYITFILHHCPFLQGKSVNFLSLRLKRNSDSNLSLLNSLIFKLELPSCLPSISKLINEDPQKGWVGWEKNERGKMGPRLSNMKSFMDPKELAESSVDLNLKLMKWRLLSNIDLEKIKQTKFLLLGSGTLGCSVARIILGWGARHISFVDNSTVSYSNPVRQSLFTFEDSKYAKPKSLAAADNLRNIFPGVKSSSFQLTIPMPGHSIGESMLEEVKKDVDMLVNLIQEHDIIFLLMDSRESRWLPTVLGTYFNKIVINAALGFDSYLVMRHGVRIDMEEVKVRQHTPGFKSLKGNYLGCYFCNDVTAPGNSMKDRTLDQQCTVTRPGVSAIAGALSAELAISILQHKEGAKAPAFFKIGNVVDTEKELDNQCVLGLIPHSIRGYLSTFSQVLPATERYNMCVACSDVVQNAFDQDRFNFLLKVFQNSEYLEIITGLSELTKEAENIGVWEFSDEEEIECVSYEYSKLDLSASSSVEGNKSRGEIVVEDFSYNQNRTILQDHKALIMEEIDQSGATTSTFGVEDFIKTQQSEISTESFTEKRLASDILRRILSEVTKLVSNESLNVEQVIPKISSTDFVNHVLSSEISTIQEKTKILHSESVIKEEQYKEGIHKMDQIEFHSPITRELKIFDSNNPNSSESRFSNHVTSTVNLNILDSEEVLVIKEKQSLESSFHSLMKDSSIFEISGSPSVPRELLPILEKQKAVSGARFVSQQSNSRFKDEFKMFKSKVKNLMSSLSLVKKIEEKTDDNYRSGDHFQTQNKLPFMKMRNMLPPRTVENMNQTKSNMSNIITLKSKIRSFVSSDSVESSDNLYNVDETEMRSASLRKSKMPEIVTFLAINTLTSSESLCDDILSDRKDKENPDIIMLSKPHDIFSSGSLTSENLGIDDSIYYLAETDSEKKIADK